MRLHDIGPPVYFFRVRFEFSRWRRDTAGASREIVDRTNRSPGYRTALANQLGQ